MPPDDARRPREAANSFVVKLYDGTVVPWGPPFSEAHLTPDSRYYGRVLAALDAMMPDAGLTFVLTWSVDDVPVRGPNVVVLLVGDNWCRWPRYSEDVRAVFKTQGTWPYLGRTSAVRDPLLAVMLLLQWVRVHLLGARGRRMQLVRWLSPWRARSYVGVVPLACYQVREVPDLDWEEREVDIGFFGSVTHKTSSRTTLRSVVAGPKVLARRRMLQALDDVRARRPDLKIATRETPSFSASTTADPLEYSRAMARCRVALVPRGTSPESFRYFEAHKFGCVVVAEALPPHWLYRDRANLTARSWGDLSAIVDRLFPPAPAGGGEPSRRVGPGPGFQQLARARWLDTFSEEAVAAHIGGVLARSAR